MGIGFGSFQNAKRPETPNYAAAEAMDVKLMNEAQARADSLRSSNMMGGATLYNEGMGDRSPIADYIFGEGKVADTPTSGFNDALINEQMGLEPVAADPFSTTSGFNPATTSSALEGYGTGAAPTATSGLNTAGAMEAATASEATGLPTTGATWGLNTGAAAGTEAAAAAGTEAAAAAAAEAAAAEAAAAAAAEAAAASSTGAAAGGGSTASLGAAAPYVAAALAADEYLLDGNGLETIADMYEAMGLWG